MGLPFLNSCAGTGRTPHHRGVHPAAGEYVPPFYSVPDNLPGMLAFSGHPSGLQPPGMVNGLIAGMGAMAACS